MNLEQTYSANFEIQQNLIQTMKVFIKSPVSEPALATVNYDRLKFPS
jgi:hypothetical protein